MVDDERNLKQTFIQNVFENIVSLSMIRLNCEQSTVKLCDVKTIKSEIRFLKSSPPKIKIVLRTNYLPGGLVSCNSLVKLTLGVAG